MARLPSREDLGPLPSDRTGKAIARLNPVSNGGAIGEAAARLGQGITKFGLTLQAKQQETDEFDTERRFQEFKWEKAKGLDEAMRAVQPGQAVQFADNWTGDYSEDAKAFFENVPDHLKPKYDAKLFDFERSGYGKAKAFEYGEQKRFSLNAIEDHKNRLAQSDDLDKARADYDSLLAANPWLTPIEKDEQRHKDLDDLDELNVAYRVSRGDDIQEIVRDLAQGEDVEKGLRAKYPHLSPKRRAALVFKAKTALSAVTQQTLDDDIARIKKSGAPDVAADGTTALDRAQGILQPNVLERKKQETAAAIVEYNAVTPLANMDPQQAQAHIASILPRAQASGASYEAGVDAEDKANAAWRKTVELREKDPALAVAQSPEVLEAEQKIAESQAVVEAGGPLFQNSMSEADMLALRLEARKTAQQRLGLKDYEISPITQAEAKELLNMGEPSSLEPDTYYDALVEAANRSEEIYGSYAHEALKAAISFQRRNKEEKEISSTVLAKIAQGIAPSPNEIRQIGDLNDIDRIGRTFEPSDGLSTEHPAIGMSPQVALPAAQARRPQQGRAVTIPPSVGQEEWLLADPRARAAVFDREFGAGAARRVIERARKAESKAQSEAPSK